MRFLALSCLLFATSAAAQGLVTDRPDFTESAVAVPLGSVQLEAGATLVWTSVGSGFDTAELGGPEALVRWSFVPGTELRIGLPDYSAREIDVISTETGTADRTTLDGVGDASLGVKVELATVAGWDLALIAEASLPLRDETFGSTVVSPLAILVAGRDLGPVSLGTQAGVRLDRVLDQVELAGTAVVGAELVPRLGVFGELAGDLVSDELDLLGHAGLTYALAPLVQLDLHAGVGLTDAAPDALVGAGVSARW